MSERNKDDICGSGYSFGLGSSRSVEPSKPKSDEEKRQDELNLLRSIKSDTLMYQVIPSREQTLNSIETTGMAAPGGIVLSSERKEVWLRDTKQTIELARQVLQERGDL